MPQICINLCEHFKKKHGASGKVALLKYQNFKYCRLCAICFKNVIGFTCPCCSSNLHYSMKQYKAEILN